MVGVGGGTGGGKGGGSGREQGMGVGEGVWVVGSWVPPTQLYSIAIQIQPWGWFVEVIGNMGVWAWIGREYCGDGCKVFGVVVCG